MPQTRRATRPVRAQVRKLACQLLRDEPRGLRFGELTARLVRQLPNVPRNTIIGAQVGFVGDLPSEIGNPAHGYYLHSKYAADSDADPRAKTRSRARESEFYEPFAEWLVNELEECTHAIPLGGNVFGNKWGTPDVIGVREKPHDSLIDFPTEIVAAEIKTNSTQLIVAFGQAIAYRLFSHKSYLVVPRSSSEGDLARLDVLARIVGIGLILFEPTSAAEPDFEIRVRAPKHDPDGFYLNKCVRCVDQRLLRPGSKDAHRGTRTRRHR